MLFIYKSFGKSNYIKLNNKLERISINIKMTTFLIRQITYYVVSIRFIFKDKGNKILILIENLILI